MQIIDRLVMIAQRDFNNQAFVGIYGSKEEIQTNCCSSPTHKQKLFSKYDLINLVTSQGLTEFIALFTKSLTVQNHGKP